MSDTKHTPGPWTVVEPVRLVDPNDLGCNDAPITIEAEESHTIPAEAVGGLPVGEQMANARLIAAAPDLLEELDNCVYILENWQTFTPKTIAQAARVARAAIAKATGS